MNTPTFNLNLSFLNERDNSTNETTNMDAKSIASGHAGDLGNETVPNVHTSSNDVFVSFFNEFPFLDELFNPFDENDCTEEKPIESKSTNPTESCHAEMDSKNESRHNVLEEKDLNAFSEANTEKTTKYATTWAVKTFKGKTITLFSKLLSLLFKSL